MKASRPKRGPRRCDARLACRTALFALDCAVAAGALLAPAVSPQPASPLTPDSTRAASSGAFVRLTFEGSMHSSFMQRFIGAVAVCLAALIAVPAWGQELKIAMAADVTSIDPHFYNLFPNNNIAEHIFDKLVQMDPDSKMIPGIATSWKPIDDKTWEYKLRKGIKFHDGSELTAEDVVFSL